MSSKSESTSRRVANLGEDKQLKAIDLLNEIKQTFQKQVTMLNALKREVTRCDNLDQGEKSTLRIQIESLLIDLNEEIFAISEELAGAFQASAINSEQLLHRAQEFEQKKIRILTKIRQSISNNPLTKIVRDESSDKQSPAPSQEKGSNLMRMLRKYSNSNSRASSKSPIVSREISTIVPIKPSQLQVHQDSVETFGQNNSPYKNSLTTFTQGQISQSLRTRKKSKSRSNSMKKKTPTPQPLRNRKNVEDITQTPAATIITRSRPQSRNSRGDSKNSTKDMGDRRLSNLTISRQSASTKKALNKIYSLKKKKSQKGAINLIPKYTGCGPGGINSSLMVRNTSSRTSFHNEKNSGAVVVPMKIYKQQSQQTNLQKKDKDLKQARQQTTILMRSETQPIMNINEHEDPLENLLTNMQKVNSRDKLTQQRTSDSFERILNLNNTRNMVTKSSRTHFKASTVGLSEPSEAVVQFSKDFDLMRKKFGDMHHKMEGYNSKVTSLTTEVSHLKDENLKLNSDIHVIRNEHSSMIHKVYELEQKNEALIRENLTLKDIIYSRKQQNNDFRAVEFEDRNKPIEIEENPRIREKPPTSAPLRFKTYQKTQHTPFHQILESPFNNAMQKMSSREKQESPPRDQEKQSYIITRHETERTKHLDGLVEESEVKQDHNTNEASSILPDTEDPELSDWVLERIVQMKQKN